MSDITLGDWSKVMYVLKPEAVRRFARLTLGLGSITVHDDLSTLNQLQIALADWLTDLRIFTDLQVGAIVQQFTPNLQKLVDNPSELITVAISNKRWVSCKGTEEFFDAQDFDTVSELPIRCITHTICDLNELYKSLLERFRRLQVVQSTTTTDRTNSS